VRIGHISQLDYVVTNGPMSPRLRDVCRDKGVQVEIAPQA
jgi:hypothetical protein